MTDLDTMLAPIRELAAKWNCEGKRCYEIANETKTVNERVIAQAVRYWECARELEALLPALAERIARRQEAFDSVMADAAVKLEKLGAKIAALIPTMDEAYRFIKSNPLVAIEILTELKALDAHDADTRNRALEEAITPELMCDFLLGKFTQYDHDWVNVAKYFREALKKTLKREKRGGE